MAGGRHYAELEWVAGRIAVFLGVAVARWLDLEQVGYKQAGFWGVNSGDGDLGHQGRLTNWAEMQRFKTGDTIGLLLDCGAGSLTVFKNGTRLGEAVAAGAHGLRAAAADVATHGGLCWCADLGGASSVRVARQPVPVDA